MADTRTINREDNIFATLASKGKPIKALMGQNFSGISEVIKTICSYTDDFRGLAQLNIRNQSQGWSINMLLRIDTKPQPQLQTEPEPPHDGLQYRFAF
ncbi:MAG: hypothetical protein IJ328_05390 [Muribaculaceae bacterium]|nr:hypothetical protein [Muribaculaceae bacterium]